VKTALKQTLLALASGMGLVAAGWAWGAPISFSPFVTSADLSSTLGNTAAIGFSYAGDKFVGSVYFGPNNNQLYQTDLNGSSVQKFGNTIPGFSGEIYVSSSLGLGGFGVRDIFAGSEALGTVYRLSNDASSQGLFLSGLAGNVRGIAFDPYGLYNFDMIVTTQTGNVYRVNAGGTATLLANVGGDAEGVDFMPQQIGPFPAGTLVVLSEGTGKLTAIAPDGTKTDLGLQFNTPEMLSFVPVNLGISGNALEGFYAANYSVNVVKADASQFVPYRGEAILTEETTHLVYRVFWDDTDALFKKENIGTFPNQPEDGIFVTAAILDPGCTVTNTCGSSIPEPGSLALLVLALGGVAVMRRSIS